MRAKEALLESTTENRKRRLSFTTVKNFLQNECVEEETINDPMMWNY